jgi:hypothetical protein
VNAHKWIATLDWPSGGTIPKSVKGWLGPPPKGEKAPAQNCTSNGGLSLRIWGCDLQRDRLSRLTHRASFSDWLPTCFPYGPLQRTSAS